MRPRQFERGALVDGDIAADFIAASGLAAGARGLPTPRRSQCRLSADAQWFLREFVRRRPEDRRPDDDERDLRRNLAEFVARVAGPPALPDRESARAFYAGYRAAERRGGAALVGREALFDESFDDYPEVA